MAEFSKELFLQALREWERYPIGIREIPAHEQSEFLKEQGYATVRDLLTHVAAWWEEGRGIISDTLKNGDNGGRKYDLDSFNTASLERFQGLSEAEFATWYESERQRMVALVSSLTVEQLGFRRVRNWLDAVLLEHLKEHGFDAPRFLVVDTLHREWGDFRANFAGLTPEKQAEYLRKQGFPRFRDVLAHILAWWEQGIAVIQAASEEHPGSVDDVNAFNAQAVARFGDLEESLVLAQYEETRLTLSSLVDMLADDVIARPIVNDRLRADVIDHYYEHVV